MKTILQLCFLLCAISVSSQSIAKTKYFRHLKYNHISPYLNINGIHPVNEATAKQSSHYVFNYDAADRLIEIVNHHYHTEKQHPLASIGVHQVKIEYQDGNEIRTFYDANGKRVSNLREVYKEVYNYDQNQFKSGLQFYDLNDNPTESNWLISAYQWEQNDEFVIERRVNLKNEMVNVSPYFDFGITGIQLDQNGASAHYNLSEDLEVQNNEQGIASYRDSFDAMGNHILYRYYNENDSLALNQWGFAVGEKSYDELGNNILLKQFDTQGTMKRDRPVYSNATIELSGKATALDSSEIRKQSLGYLKALQEMDPILMEEVLNDSLNKVTIGYDRTVKKEVARATTHTQMMAFAEDWNKSSTKFPPTPNDQITILGIYNRIASVELVSDNWVEYLHLMKLDNQWKIINLIWQHKDVKRYPK